MKPHFSPSQFTTASRCLRKWYYESVLGRRSPDTESTLRGTRIHRMLEVYVADPAHPLPTDQQTVTYTERRVVPVVNADGSVEHDREVTLPINPAESRAAQSALLLLPNPQDEQMQAEGKFSLAPEHTGFGKPTVGFIDLWRPSCNTLIDYKTRSSDRYDKEEEELRHDAQAIIYAKVKLLEVQPDPDGVRRVHFKHINIYTNGKNARMVSLDNMTEEEVELGLSRLRPLAHRMLAAEQLPVDEIPVNVKACDDFRGCPFRVECGAKGLPVYGDGWQARNAKALAISQGTYRSPEELEEKFMSFADAIFKKQQAAVQVNPPDGVPPTVVGNKDAHVAVVEAAVEAQSETDEESQGEAPSTAVVTEAPTVGRQSARDKNMQAVLDIARRFTDDSQVNAFYERLGATPSSPDELKAHLLKLPNPQLKQLAAAAAEIISGAPAPQADGPLNEPTTLEELPAFVAAAQKILTAANESISKLDAAFAAERSKRNDCEENGDDAGAEAASREMKRIAALKKSTSEQVEALKTKYTVEYFDALKAKLMPAPTAPAPVPEQAPAPTVSTTRAPLLLLRSTYIANDAHVLHIENLIGKYQAAVAAAAGVESVHEIKYEGPARVAGLLAKDINSGLIDLRKYTAVSVPRRGATWDPVIDVLRPHVLAICEGMG